MTEHDDAIVRSSYLEGTGEERAWRQATRHGPHPAVPRLAGQFSVTHLGSPLSARHLPLYDLARMATAPVDALRNVPIFAGLSDEDLEGLARQMKERRFAEGSAVTTEGAGAAGFFVIVEGDATVSVGGEQRATIGAGDYFGEIALIDEGTRSATITAATDLKCYGLTAWEFRPFVEEHPQVAWTLLQTLARRLREAQAHEHTH